MRTMNCMYSCIHYIDLVVLKWLDKLFKSLLKQHISYRTSNYVIPHESLNPCKFPSHNHTITRIITLQKYGFRCRQITKKPMGLGMLATIVKYEFSIKSHIS